MSTDDYGDRELTLDERMGQEGLSAEEHAREAEKLLHAVGSSWYSPGEDDLARAHIHATLAVARAAIEARQFRQADSPEIRPAVPR